MDQLSQIRSMEERLFNAWPAHKSIFYNGWIIRLSAGATKRANSINALSPSCPVSEIITFATTQYQKCNLPVVFRISPLASKSDDKELESLGYKSVEPCFVMTCDLENLPEQSVPGITFGSTYAKEWGKGFFANSSICPSQYQAHEDIISSISMPVAFATLTLEGQSAGYAIAVYDRQMVGLYDVIIDPVYRNKGYGKHLTKGLLQWGKRQGAEQAYLQVVEANSFARKLYANMGFAELYRYHYRIV